MTETLVSLGFAPGTGTVAVEQCVRFKRLMHDVIGHDPDGAFLKTVSQDGKRGLAVEYDREIDGAEAWARAAEEMAPAVWEMVARAERVRVR